MNVAELFAFLKRIGAEPKKSLSQNFLIDPNVTRKIVQTAEVAADDLILEIGPGPGALTEELLKTGARVIAIEMDRVFAKELSRFQNGRLTIIESDVLKFNLDAIPDGMKVVANLPYHITTPILEKLFARDFKSITIMVQKEVATRMMAKPHTKEMGSLTLFVQFHSEYKSSFTVPAAAFYPMPKVDSTVIRLDKKAAPPVRAFAFFTLVHAGFQQRRKMLTSTLPAPKEEIKKALAKIGMRLDARPEMLSFDQWVLLTKELDHLLLQE